MARHVGRSTNEKVEARKRKQMLKILIPTGIVAVITIILISKGGLKGLMGDSVIIDENGCELICEEGYNLSSNHKVCEKITSSETTQTEIKTYLIGDLNYDNIIDEQDLEVLKTLIDNPDEMTNEIKLISNIDENDNQYLTQEDYNALYLYINNKSNSLNSVAYVNNNKIGTVAEGICPNDKDIIKSTNELGNTVITKKEYIKNNDKTCAVNITTTTEKKETKDVKKQCKSIYEQKPTNSQDVDGNEIKGYKCTVNSDGEYNCKDEKSSKDKVEEYEELELTDEVVINKRSNYLNYGDNNTTLSINFKDFSNGYYINDLGNMKLKMYKTENCSDEGSVFNFENNGELNILKIKSNKYKSEYIQQPSKKTLEVDSSIKSIEIVNPPKGYISPDNKCLNLTTNTEITLNPEKTVLIAFDNTYIGFPPPIGESIGKYYTVNSNINTVIENGNLGKDFKGWIAYKKYNGTTKYWCVKGKQIGFFIKKQCEKYPILKENTNVIKVIDKAENGSNVIFRSQFDNNNTYLKQVKEETKDDNKTITLQLKTKSKNTFYIQGINYYYNVYTKKPEFNYVRNCKAIKKDETISMSFYLNADQKYIVARLYTDDKCSKEYKENGENVSYKTKKYDSVYQSTISYDDIFYTNQRNEIINSDVSVLITEPKDTLDYTSNMTLGLSYKYEVKKGEYYQKYSKIKNGKIESYICQRITNGMNLFYKIKVTETSINQYGMSTIYNDNKCEHKVGEIMSSTYNVSDIIKPSIISDEDTIDNSKIYESNDKITVNLKYSNEFNIPYYYKIVKYYNNNAVEEESKCSLVKNKDEQVILNMSKSDRYFTVNLYQDEKCTKKDSVIYESNNYKSNDITQNIARTTKGYKINNELSVKINGPQNTAIYKNDSITIQSLFNLNNNLKNYYYKFVTYKNDKKDSSSNCKLIQNKINPYLNIKIDKEKVQVKVKIYKDSKCEKELNGSNLVESKIYNGTLIKDKNFLKCINIPKETTINTSYFYSIKSLWCPNKKIKNLVGIELIPNLESLNVDKNNLTELDVSKNKNLESLSVGNNKLTKLITNNPKLTYLRAKSNNLTKLDVSKNKNLEYLEVEDNKLTKLITNNPKLTYLCAYSNNLTKLDVSKNKNLEDLDVDYNKLTKLITNNPKLTTLRAKSNNLTKLDVSKNKNLVKLSVEDNKLTKLITNNPKLTTLRAYSNNLTELDVSKNKNLEYLDVDYNKLTKLITNNPKLTTLKANSNNLTKLDVSKNKNLVDLLVHDNKLTKLITNNPKLTTLWAYSNNLTKLDVSKNKNLEYLDVDYNKLTKLITNNPKLTTLKANSNNLTKLDVSKNKNLETLFVDHNVKIIK